MYPYFIPFIYTYTYFTMLAFCTVIPRTGNTTGIGGQYNSTNVYSEQVLSILEQNNGILDNPDEPNSTENQCQLCHIRESQKRLRKESIKNKLMHALRLDVFGLPNVTRRRFPRVPSYERIQEQYNREIDLEEMRMQSDQPYSYEERVVEVEEEFGRPERTFIMSENPPTSLGIEVPNAVYFNIPRMENRDVRRAILWVYIAPRSQFHLPKNVSEIFLYKLVPPGKRGGPPVKRFLKKRKRAISNVIGWHHFDVTDLARRWASNPSTNLGIVVEALDGNDENLIVLPTGSANNIGFEPSLDFKTTTAVQNHRRKRSTVLNCNEENQFDTCCRYPLTVDFVEFGWDFVIAPQRYDAYYCAGECRHEGLSQSGHSAVVQHIPDSRTIGSNPGPCCTPVRMATLKMLYFDHNSRIQLTTLPRMKVMRCGCA